MSDRADKKYQAGQWLDDYCRQCKLSRRHTVLVVSPEGVPLRVSCDTCAAQHNYRFDRQPGTRSDQSRSGTATKQAPGAPPPFPTVSERERSMPEMNEAQSGDLELMLRRVIREETGLTAATPAEKWRGGDLILRPGREGLQDKTWPIETFFHKIVMVRNRLRTLEQQVNSSDLPEDTKVKLQGYITGCYGSLTSFNVLFADEEDRI